MSPRWQVKIVDPATDKTVPTGTSGEVCSRGYLVMKGYWENPEATSAAVDADGWMHTDNLGLMDDEGYVNIVGRSTDMLIRAGRTSTRAKSKRSCSDIRRSRQCR